MPNKGIFAEKQDDELIQQNMYLETEKSDDLSQKVQCMEDI